MSFKIGFNLIFPSTIKSSKLPLSFVFPYQNHVRNSLLHHTFHTPYPSHSPSLYHPQIWLLVQIMKTLTSQFSKASCSFFTYGLKYLPQHHILEHPQPMIFSQCTKLNFTSFIFLKVRQEDTGLWAEWSQHSLNLERS